MRLEDLRRSRRDAWVVVAFWLSYVGVCLGFFLWFGLGAVVTWLSLSTFVLLLMVIA